MHDANDILIDLLVEAGSDGGQGYVPLPDAGAASRTAQAPAYF